MKNKFFKNLKISKRIKLYIANVTAIIFWIVCLMCEWAILGVTPDKTILKYVLIQCVFTFLSLIVYYLSIIADALNKQYAEQEKKLQDEKDK